LQLKSIHSVVLKSICSDYHYRHHHIVIAPPLISL